MCMDVPIQVIIPTNRLSLLKSTILDNAFTNRQAMGNWLE
jgi:hypothetical protein